MDAARTVCVLRPTAKPAALSIEFDHLEHERGLNLLFQKLLAWLRHRPDTSLLGHFLRVWIVSAIPLTALAAFAAAAFPEEHSVARATHVDRTSPLFDVVLTVLLAPAIETALLVYVTAVAVSALTPLWRAAVVGALALSALHAYIAWFKPFVLFWPFFVQAFVYLDLRGRGLPFRSAWGFVFALHSTMNAVALALAFAPTS